MLQCHLSTRTLRQLTAGWRTQNHTHPFYELGIVTSGHCVWIVDETPSNAPGQASGAPRRLELRSGEAILIPPSQWHYEEVGPERAALEWTGMSISDAALQEVPLSEKLALKDWKAEILACTRQIHLETVQRPAAYNERIPLLLADLLLLLQRVSRAVPAPRPHLSRADHLEAARLFLEQTAGNELSISQVAHYHGYSISHFEVLFARRYGTTPKRYQQQHRLKAVLKSLASGIRSPKELAALHGFSDAAYFCRWFRRETGTTPSQWAAAVTIRL